MMFLRSWPPVQIVRRHRRYPLCLALLLALSATGAAQAPKQQPSFDRLSKLADTARQENRLDDAIGFYRRALKVRTSWKDGWWYLSTILYDQDRYPEARDTFRKLVTLDAKNGAALALLGLCEFETKDYGPSLVHLNRARVIGFGDNKQMAQVAFYHNTILLTRFEQFESALELSMQMIQRDMSSAKVIEAAGLAALRMPILPEDLQVQDRELVVLTGTAVCTAGGRNAADAQRLFQELVAKFPNAPNVHYVYGTYLLLNDPDAGLREIHKELDLSPDHLPSLVTLSFEYLKKGEPEKGLQYAERAVKSAPASFAAYAALGRVLVDSGKTQEGIEKLEYAAKLAPDSPQVRIALASAYAKVGRSADAARERAEFLKLKNGDRTQQQ
jgi:tetratricopeptide (TPR) repeat protein